LTGETDLDATFLAAPMDIEALPDRRGQIAEYLGGLRGLFTQRCSACCGEPCDRTPRALGERGPLGELRADEWAYLQSNSILATFTRAALDAFRDAGSVILEMGRDVGWFLVKETKSANPG
jgi:hypothetical protein